MTANTGPEEQTSPTEEKYYTPLELAAKLKVHRRTIISWIKDPTHPLQGIKLDNTLWRVTDSSLKAFLQKEYGNGSSGH